MTKKDRIAVSISFIILIIGILDYDGAGPALCFPALILYWLFRFIKNDISFIKSKDKRESEKKKSSINSIPDELLKWNELLTKGAITQEEYDKAKRDLLS